MVHHHNCRGLLAACAVMVAATVSARGGLVTAGQNDAPDPSADPLQVDQTHPVASGVNGNAAPITLNATDRSTTDSTLPDSIHHAVPAPASLDAQVAPGGDHHEFFWGGWADRSTGPLRNIELWDDLPRAAAPSNTDVALGSPLPAGIDEQAPTSAIIPLPTPAMTGFATLAGLGVVAWFRSIRARTR